MARSSGRLGAGPAATENLESVVLGLETVGATDLGAQRDDARADELDHPAAAFADQMIVLLAGVDVLVESVARAQALAADEATLDQQIEVAIDRSARHRNAPAAERAEEGAGIEVDVLLEDFFADGAALGGHAQAARVDKVLEDSQLSGSGHRLDLLETSSQ
jgi:hypothetical protein